MIEVLSRKRLDECSPVLAAKVADAAAMLAVRGVYIRVADAFRTYAYQNGLWARGRTVQGKIVTNARGGYSNHNFGCAVDCYPFANGQDGELDWNPQSPKFLAMVVALKAEGLAWGGDWKTMHDPPHFQLANVAVTPTDADRSAFAMGGLKQVWERYGIG